MMLSFSGATYVVAGTDYTDWYPGVLDSAYNITNPCLNWDRFLQSPTKDIEAAINLLYSSNGTINTIDCNQLPSHVLVLARQKGNPHFKNINGFELPDIYEIPL